MKYPFYPYKKDGNWGEQRSTHWLHTGEDLNGVNGGDSDCGFALYPITYGRTIFQGKVTTGYSNILVYEITGSWGTYYVRYAHLKEVPNNPEYLEPRKPCAIMGKSGTQICHLHADLFIKKPPHWGWFAKTRSELIEYTISLTEFIKNNKDREGQMPAVDKTELYKKKIDKLEADLLDARTGRGKMLHAVGLVPEPTHEYDADSDEAVKIIEELRKTAGKVKSLEDSLKTNEEYLTLVKKECQLSADENQAYISKFLHKFRLLTGYDVANLNFVLEYIKEQQTSNKEKQTRSISQVVNELITLIINKLRKS